MSNVVSRSLYRQMLLNEKASKPTVIGLTSWGTVTERTRDVLKERVKIYLLLSSIKKIRAAANFE